MNLATLENEFSPLCAACIAGNFEVVELLAENGANVNFQNSVGQSPLVHCMSRMTETESVFENKTVCLKIAEMLFLYSADVD